MKRKKPGSSRIRSAFVAVVAALGVGGGTGLIETLPKDQDTDTQKITTYNRGTEQAYGYNISPVDQMWKATLSQKSIETRVNDFYRAAKNGDSWRVQALIDHGLMMQQVGEDYYASLVMLGIAANKAAAGGHADVIRLLAKAGAGVTMGDNEALISAAKGGHRKAVMALLNAGADAKARNSAALWISAMDGHAGMTEDLIRRGADVNANEGAALRYAAQNGHLLTVNALISAGADIQIKNNEALLLAAQNGHSNVVLQLVWAQANSAAGNSAALRAAAANGHTDVVRILLSQTITITVTDRFSGVATLQSGVRAADVNANGGEALAMAILNGHGPVVIELLNAGTKTDLPKVREAQKAQNEAIKEVLSNHKTKASSNAPRL